MFNLRRGTLVKEKTNLNVPEVLPHDEGGGLFSGVSTTHKVLKSTALA